jgi:undecaprenyl-diphosphatase
MQRPQWRRVALLAGVPALVWLGVLVGAGWLLGGPVAGPLQDEDAVVAGLQADRTPTLDEISHWVSWSANTGTIVVGAALLGLALRWAWSSWLEPMLLWAGVALQSAVFLTTTLLVSRERPNLDKLDPAPPTSSFPSGHTGASTALWLGLALLLCAHIRSRPWRVVLTLGLLCIPVGVALSRLYRGMHHPSDVTFGLLNGTAAVLIARYAVLHRPGEDLEESTDVTVSA